MGNSQEPQDFNISVMPSSLTPVHVAKAAEGLNLYDTASHQVSHFVPLKPGEVGIYVCARLCNRHRILAISVPPWRSTSCAAGF